MSDVVSLPDRGRSRAVLIGASAFEHLTPLPAVRNNLADLRAALTHPDHGIIAPENCEIVDGPSSPRELMAPLRGAARRTDDLLLVYYAGHGLRHENRDELYLTAGETEADALAESAVSFNAVKDVLEGSSARTNLLVLDCCYSGMALSTMSGVAVEAREIAVSGSAVLASSPKNRKSHSPAGRRHTAFTGKMISLLEQGSPNDDELLTVNALYKRVSVALVREEFPRPLIKLTDTSGDLLVRRPAPARPAPPPAVRSEPAEPVPAEPVVAEPTPQVPHPESPPEQTDLPHAGSVRSRRWPAPP
jgi:hypothetical protein